MTWTCVSTWVHVSTKPWCILSAQRLAGLAKAEEPRCLPGAVHALGPICSYSTAAHSLSPSSLGMDSALIGRKELSQVLCFEFFMSLPLLFEFKLFRGGTEAQEAGEAGIGSQRLPPEKCVVN